MTTVRWTDEAIDQLDRIRAYVSWSRPQAAQRLVQRIIAAAESLAAFPERGQPLTGDRRELLVTPPYRIRYRIRDGEVQILRIRHGSRAEDGLEEEPSIFDFEDADAEMAADEQGLADIREGRVISHKAVRAWLLSWGTPNELPCPKVGD